MSTAEPSHGGRPSTSDAHAAEREGALESLINTLGGIVWEADPSTFAVSFVSQPAERILGYPLHRWLDDPSFWMEHIHPEDRRWVVDHCVATTARGEDHEFEYRMIAADGRVVWIHDVVTVKTDDEGRPILIRGVMVDVTRRKEAERAQFEAERRFRETLEHTHLLSVIVDSEGRVSYCNDALLKLTGRERDDVIGGDWFTLFLQAPEQRGAREQFEAAVRRQEAPAQRESEIVTGDGDVRVIAWNNTLLRDKDGRVTGISGLGADVTLARHDEAHLRRSEADEREAAAYRSAVLNALPAHIAVIDESGTIVSVNEAWSQFAREAGVDAGGRSEGANYLDICRSAVADGAEQAREIESGIRRVLAGQAPAFEIEYPCHGPDEHHWFRMMVTPLSHEGIRGAVIAHVNVSERRRAEQALEEKERAFGTLLSNLPGFTYRCRNERGWPMEFVSEGVEEVTGYTADKFVRSGRLSTDDLMVPEDVDRVWHHVQEMVGRGHPFQLSYRIHTARGETRWLWEQGRGVHDERGELVALEGFVTDITDRMQAVQALEHRLNIESLVARVSHAFVNCRADRIDSVVDDALEQIGTLCAADRAYLFLLTEDGTVLRNTHEWCAAGVEPHIDRFQHVSIHDVPWWYGQLAQFETIYIPRRSDLPPEAEAEAERELLAEHSIQSLVAVPLGIGGELRGFLGLDMVHRQWAWSAEDTSLLATMGQIIVNAYERARTEAALQESEANYRLLADNSTDLVSLHELDGRYVYVSPSWESVTGYPVDMLIGRSPYTLMHPDDQERIREEIHPRAAAGENVYTTWRLRRRDGSYILVETSTTHITDDQRRPVRLLCSTRDITDRRLAEDALRASEERFSRVFHASPIAIAISTPDEGRFIDLNASFEQLLGYDRHELIGRSVMEIDYWVDPDERNRLLGVLRTKGEISNYEVRFRRRSGQTGHALTSVELITLGDQECLLSMIIDITDRKEAEIALSESEARFHGFMDHNPAAAWIKDEHGRYVYVNRTFQETYQVTTEDVIGRTDFELLPGHVARTLTGHDHEALEYGVVDRIEVIPNPDGEEHIWLVMKFLLGEQQGSRLVGGVALDITAQKRAETELARREREFKALVENTPDIIARFDRDGRFLYVNPAVGGAFDVSAEAMIGRPVDEAGLPGEPAASLKAELQQVVQRGRDHVIELDLPTDDRTVHLETRLVPEFNEAGDIESILSISRDISVRKRAEAELRRSSDLHRMVLSELDHRVRNNLASLTALIDLSARIEQNVEQFAQSVKGRVQAMAAVHALLSRGHWKMVRLADLIGAVVPEDLRPAIRMTGPNFELVPQQLTALGMVLQELTANSLKYGSLSRSGGRVELMWKVVGETDDAYNVELRWRETGGPPVTPPDGRGLGTDLIRGFVRAELRGEAELTFPPEGVDHVLHIQIVRYSDPARGAGQHSN